MKTGWSILATLLAIAAVCFPASRGDVRPRAAGAAPPLPTYQLNVDARPAERRVRVSGSVTFQVREADGPVSLSLTRLAGNVEIRLAAATANSAEVEIVRPSGAEDSYRLRAPRTRGQRTMTLIFSYDLQGGPARLFYVGPEIALASGYGTDWYPVVEGADRVVGTLAVTAPAGYRVVSEGASEATPAEEARGIFRFSESRPTYFTFLAGRFVAVSQPGSIPVRAYLLQDHARTKEFLGGVQSILGVLQEEFGRYPFPQLTLVEVPREIAQQAGFNAFAIRGVLVLNHRAFDVPDIAFLYEWLGHEIGHQWFPHAVALRTPPGLYMEEALAEYGGLRVVERLAGPDAAEAFRRTGYAADPIYGARQYFSLVAAGCDSPLSQLRPGTSGRDLAYNKGFLVWNAVAEEIGRAKFRTALARIANDHRFGDIGWQSFLDEIERFAGRDLAPLYEQWFDRTGLPDWSVAWRQRGNVVRGQIGQVAPYYRATLEVELRGAGQGQILTHRLRLRPARETSFTLAAPFPVTKVVVDPHYKIPHWTTDYRAQVGDARQPERPAICR